jgi:hypothetical protein
MSLSTRISERPLVIPWTVQELVRQAQRGRLRTPFFQRPLRWRSAEVAAFFDSLYHGYPVGELLLHAEPQAAERLIIGGSPVDAPAGEGWSIIDGQQRIVSLAGTLLHPDVEPRHGIFAIWFDLETEQFFRLGAGPIAPTFLPLRVALDASNLMRWLLARPAVHADAELTERALELGKAIREYPLSVYQLRGASESELKEVFKRRNTSGMALQATEVFEATHGTPAAPRPLGALVDRLRQAGWRGFEEKWMTTILLALKGQNLRRRSQLTDRDWTESLPEAEAALRRVHRFLVDDAEIAHSALLPYSAPIPILARFFSLWPLPSRRDRLRLRAWLWRGALTQLHQDNSNSTLGAALACLHSEPSASVTRLLATTSRQTILPSSLSEDWRSNAARSRLFALALAHLRPRCPGRGEPLDLGGSDRPEIEPLVASKAVAVRAWGDWRGTPLFSSHPEVLASHALTSELLALRQTGQNQAFVQARGALLDAVAHPYFRAMAELDDPLRPSIAALTRAAEAAP